MPTIDLKGQKSDFPQHKSGLFFKVESDPPPMVKNRYGCGLWRSNRPFALKLHRQLNTRCICLLVLPRFVPTEEQIAAVREVAEVFFNGFGPVPRGTASLHVFSGW